MDTGLSYFVDRQDMDGVDNLIDELLGRPIPIARTSDFYPHTKKVNHKVGDKKQYDRNRGLQSHTLHLNGHI